MNLEIEVSWPPVLMDYLNENAETLMAYAQREENDNERVVSGEISSAFLPHNPYCNNYQKATMDVVQLLQDTTLRGWHCTRLTAREVACVKQYGMQLPNQSFLKSRIEQVQNDGLISVDVAERLNSVNQADDDNRKGMIWFCFSPPFKGEQHGIERFFRRWGGEALYNYHESDLVTGVELTKIGQPCLIEVDVPVAYFPEFTWLGDHLIRRYLIQRRLKTEECVDHTNRSLQQIPPKNIVRIIMYGDDDFISLTRCDQWSPPL